MARIRINCGCIDAPCCGCDEVILTGEDALERMQEENFEMDLEERDRKEQEMDNRRFDDDTMDMHDIAFEDRMCGESW